VDERLETQRLVLRRPGDGDLPAYALVIGDGAALELRDALAHWRAHGFGPWIVEAAGAVVGILEVHYTGPGVTGIAPDEVELGWTIVVPVRGGGLATEAARAAASDAFARADAPWLVAYVRPENAASIRVAEKLGMRHDADGLTRSGEPMLIYRLRPEGTM
jgi:RimJ/RimL family protein N-acetyltransferase